MHRTLGRRAVTLVAAIVAVSALAGTALALDWFSDVPEGAWFYNDVSAIAGGGVTAGYADGTYRPSNNVSRAEMAAFLERSMGRVGFGADYDDAVVGWDIDGAGASSELALIAAVTIDAGATASGNGFVVLNASFEPWTIGANGWACPCVLEFLILDDEFNPVSPLRFAYVPADAGEMEFMGATGSVTGVVPFAADDIETYTFWAFLDDSDVPWIAIDGEMSAIYVPLGPDGDNTLLYDSVAPTSNSLSLPENVVLELFGGGGK